MQKSVHKRLFADLKGLWHWLWAKRVGKNSVLSLVAWGLMYILFYIEVSQLDWQSQHAKLAWSAMGLPLGIAIQVFVFRDRLKAIRARMTEWSARRNLWSATKLLTRWGLAKFLFFLLNQTAYALMLHRVGLPYWLAALLIAPLISFLYFAVTTLWVIAAQRGVPKTKTA